MIAVESLEASSVSSWNSFVAFNWMEKIFLTHLNQYAP